VAIYLDGLSRGIHGNEARQRADAIIRDQLEDQGWSVVPIAASHLDDPVVLAADFRRVARALKRRDIAEAVAEDTAWYDGTPEANEEGAPLPLLERSTAQPYVKHVPLYSIRAAAGRFLENEEAEEEGWVEAPGTLREGMFAIRIEGRSMEPAIPDGAVALFVANPAGGPLPGSREGKIVLARLSEASDPEGGGSYTVKRYHSEKIPDDGGWRHVSIELRSLNPEVPSITLTPEQEVDVIAEFVSVLGRSSEIAAASL
jgi:SOS-response transcriptional repressor LexA